MQETNKVPLATLIEFHKDLHNSLGYPCQTSQAILSIDGVPEDTGGKKSINIFGIQFPPCRSLYHFRTLREHKDHKATVHEALRELVDELNNNGTMFLYNIYIMFPFPLFVSAIVIRFIIADAPMRAFLMNMFRFNKKQGACSQCYQRPITVRDNNGNAMGLGWPYESSLRLRTHLAFVRLERKLSRLPQQQRDRGLKGIKGYTPLYDLPSLDFVHDIPCEWMHSVCEGNVKKAMGLTFKLPALNKRGRVTNMPYVPLEDINKALRKVLVPHEFSRPVHELSAKMKAEQYKYLIVGYYPIVLEALEGREEGRIWALLAYLSLALVLPGE